MAKTHRLRPSVSPGRILGHRGTARWWLGQLSLLCSRTFHHDLPSSLTHCAVMRPACCKGSRGIRDDGKPSLPSRSFQAAGAVEHWPPPKRSGTERLHSQAQAASATSHPATVSPSLPLLTSATLPSNPQPQTHAPWLA